MSLESPLTRWWDAVRPPPSTETLGKAARAQKRKQRRLIWGTVVAATVLACGWYVYDYIASAPLRAQAEFARGMHRMAPGAYQEAIAVFDRAIAIWPGMADAYLNRGIAERALGRADAALADLDKATGLDPNLTRAYDERGRIHAEKGDNPRAVEEFTKSIRTRSTTDGYYQRGLAYEAMGEHRKAVADFDNAIAQQPDAPYAYRARALARANLGDAEGAKEDRETAQRIELIH
jgi:tetratricopeptide (TPR) repeat protein